MAHLLLATVVWIGSADPQSNEPLERVIARLTEVVADPLAHPFAKKEALRTLGKYGAQARVAVPELVLQFRIIRRGQDLPLQEAIVDVLGKIGPAARTAIPVLTRLVGQDLDIDRAVTRAIDRIMLPPEWIEIQELVKELRHKDPSHRLKAAKALGMLGRKADIAVPALFEVLLDSDSDVRRMALTALRTIQPDAKPADAIIQAYILDLQDADDSVRLLAARMLGRIGPPAAAAIPALEKAAADSVADVRQTATDALAKISPQ